MANNTLSNGGVPHHSANRRSERSIDKSKKDIPAIECRNWLLHRHYTRHEYKISKYLIDQELTNSNGHNEYASYLKGLILRREGKIQVSLDCFQNCYNVNSTNVNNVKQIAKSLFLLGSHKRAVDAYLEAGRMSAAPDWEIHHSLGECYVKLNLSEDAKREFKRSTELTKNEIPYLSLARLYVEENRVNDAIEVYSAALKTPCESEDAAIELGLVYLRAGDDQQAFQQFGTVLAQSAGCTAAIVPMAYIIQTHQEYDVALFKYKTAVQMLPESYHLWNNIGMCLYGKQKVVAAISCLKRAHYLNPMALLPACNLGRVLLTTGQPASAAIYLCSAVTAAPKNPQPYLLLGIALKKLEDLEGSEKALSKAHALTPQDPLTLINYAVILEERGKRDRANEILSDLKDIAAVTTVEPQIVETARGLSRRLLASARITEDKRVLNEDEV
ncbi:Bardet-Biedl syndrome 4 protein [Diachasma alloeum]|uniref:Bardet-Biedl syndrome 4 protein n=1 Tax=Diachasma alloeum TaxID=454923 RepID=UPI0007383950|nr:Bardet-Biedl syndrome 4 protein [Diachasma alloeum]